MNKTSKRSTTETKGSAKAMRYIAFVAGLAALIVSFSLLGRATAPQVPTNTWAPTGDMSVGRAGASAVLLYDGRMLVTGGMTDNGVSASAERYSPSGGAFLSTPSMSAARANHTSTLLPDGRVLVAGGAGADGHAAGHAAPKALDRLARLVEHPEGAARVLEEHCAGLGRHRAPAAADQERDPQLPFEVAHVVADRRLAQVKRLAGPREAARAGDRLERPDVHRIDVHRLSGRARPGQVSRIRSIRTIHFTNRTTGRTLGVCPTWPSAPPSRPTPTRSP